MAKYTSHYPSLMFYVKGDLKRFASGEYVTDDKDEIAVLDGLSDVTKANEPQAIKPEADEQPAPKKAPRKASTK